MYTYKRATHCALQNDDDLHYSNYSRFQMMSVRILADLHFLKVSVISHNYFVFILN